MQDEDTIRQRPAGIKVSDADMATRQLERDPFHGKWSYTVRPHSTPNGVAIAYYTHR